MNNLYKLILMTTVAGLGSSAAFAQDKDSPFSLSASLGYEFDSNLTVDAIDNTSNVGDEALVIDASVGFDFVDNEKFGVSAGYDFYQSSHNDLTEFDMVIHGFNADTRYSLDRTDFGFTVMFNDIQLGGESFMDMTTVRPNVGYLFGSNTVYLLGAYEYQKQNFDLIDLQGREATRHSGSIKSIFILGGGKTATIGYEYNDHSTVDPGFSYKGHNFDASVKIPADMFNRETIFRAGYRFQNRDYDAASLDYNPEIREDRRHTFSTSWEVPLGAGFTGEVEFEYISSISNFEPVDYNESITTFKIGWEF